MTPQLAALGAVTILSFGASNASAAPGCAAVTCRERVAMHACSQAEPVACIRRAALHHRVSFRLQLAIARCESGLSAGATNASGASGLMQFMPGTFSETPYRWRSIWSAKWQALAGAWALRHWGAGPWTASRPCWAGRV